MQLWWRRLACRCRDHTLAPIYRIYEHRLLRQGPGFSRAAPHRANPGRQSTVWPPKQCESDDVYMAGANKLDDLLDWCVELEIPAITLWVCSTENLKRPPEQVTSILAAVEKKLKLLADDGQTHRRRIQVRAVGRLELLPPSTLAAVRAAEAATQDYRGVQLTIAAAYGGREEIVDAVRALLREQLAQNKSLNEIIGLVTPEAIGRSLYAPIFPTPTSSSGRAARFDFPGSCCGRARLASSTLRCLLASLPADRFFEGGAGLSGAPKAFREVGPARTSSEADGDSASTPAARAYPTYRAGRPPSCCRAKGLMAAEVRPEGRRRPGASLSYLAPHSRGGHGVKQLFLGANSFHFAKITTYTCTYCKASPALALSRVPKASWS